MRTPIRTGKRTSNAIVGVGCALVLVLGFAGASLASKPTPGAKYKGKTDEKTPASFRVAKSGKRIPSYLFYFSYRCSNGTHGPTAFGSNKQTKPIPVAKSGTFALRETVRPPSGGDRITFTIRGAFVHAGKQASGYFTQHIRGKGGLTCTSGRVTFKVHRL